MEEHVTSTSLLRIPCISYQSGGQPRKESTGHQSKVDLPLLLLRVSQEVVFFPNRLSGPDLHAQKPESLWFLVQSV